MKWMGAVSNTYSVSVSVYFFFSFLFPISVTRERNGGGDAVRWLGYASWRHGMNGSHLELDFGTGYESRGVGLMKA